MTDESSCRLLVEQVGLVAIVILDTAGIVRTWNQGAERILGYSASDVIGRDTAAFFTPEDAAQQPRNLLEQVAVAGQVEHEEWRVRKDGSRFWAEVLTTALRDSSGALRGFGMVIRDLTTRKQAEETLSQLSGRLLSIQDDERRRHARELHDTTSPLLTQLVSRLYPLRASARSAGKGLQGQIEESLSLAQASSELIRLHSALLHPPQLDQSGLVPSLRWYIDAFTAKTGLLVGARLAESATAAPEAEVALFRLAQEWLTGMLRGGATRARLHVLLEDDVMVALHIEGVDADWPADVAAGLRNGAGELGVTIAAMRARFKQLGGCLDVLWSPPPMAVTATVPRLARS